MYLCYNRAIDVGELPRLLSLKAPPTLRSVTSFILPQQGAEPLTQFDFDRRLLNGAFFIGYSFMQRVAPTIQAVVEPVVVGLGYEYVGSEFGQAENGTTLRVYIDAPNGIEVDDCASVSRQLSAALDVDDVIASAYLLEVSSPGIDRPLFTEGQFAAQVGQEVKARTTSAHDGRRNYKGLLVSVAEGEATFEIDGIDYTVPINDVEQANLIGKF